MKDLDDLPGLMAELGARARRAATELGFATPEQKAQALEAAADAVAERQDEILQANAQDLDYGRSKGLSDAMMDRLRLDEDRIGGIVAGLRAIAAQDDPVGATMAEWDRPSGLNIRRVRTPLGVIGVIVRDRVLCRCVDDVQKHRAAFDMAEKPVADAAALVSAFDQPWYIGDDELRPVDPDDPEIGVQRREGVVRDLGPGIGGRGKEG